MFKVKKIDYINKTFRLNKELVESLEKLAQEKGISLNQLVSQCCEYALNNLDKNESDT